MSKAKVLNEFITENRKSKHLGLQERIIIESCLNSGSSFKDIAMAIGKDPSTVSKEIRRNRITKLPNSFNSGTNVCAKVTTCLKTNLCQSLLNCSSLCRSCSKFDCMEICPDFEPIICFTTTHAPYVCNACNKRKQCRRHTKYYYDAGRAQIRYIGTLKDCRKGINISEDELAELDSLISPLLKRGQSINHIYANHKTEIPCSKKTLYEYIDKGLLTVINLDLTRKVRYKKRKKRQIENAKDQYYRTNRKYEDFLNHLLLNPNISVVEMDVVEGLKTESKVLLTLLFRSCNLMLIFLLESQTQAEVKKVFDSLELDLGYDLFSKLFPILITDNGSEFKDPTGIETSLDGQKRTQVYYCESYASWQKGKLEKNHEFIRYVLPKGSSFENLTPEKVFRLRNHINCFSRDSLNGNSPRDLAKLLIPKEAIEIMRLQRIPADEVMLKPHLLK